MTHSAAPRRVMVVTGSRAEFGLLEPVMHAIAGHRALSLGVVVAGSHLVGPALTWRDVEAAGFEIAARVPMQGAGVSGRLADAESVGRGISGLAGVYSAARPEWVVVLGDRIEAFAAAAAASIAGIAVAHLHGGDRAEGIADEALRHAITKLAHLHLAATDESRQRLVRLGESERFVHVVGSPAMDGLAGVAVMDEASARGLGDPLVVLLLHPSGLDEERERRTARCAVAACAAHAGTRVVVMAPNLDAGREAVLEELRDACAARGWRFLEHLPRSGFVGLLKRVASLGGALVGNSSAGLIEAPALGLASVDIGPRQAGRERPASVTHCEGWDESDVGQALTRASQIRPDPSAHPYGDGRVGARVAELLAAVDPHDPAMVRKRCTY